MNIAAPIVLPKSREGRMTPAATEAERHISGSERELASIIDNLPGLAYRCGLCAPWHMMFISDAVMELTGYASGSFLSGELTWEDLIEPAERRAVADQVAGALKRREKFNLRYRIRNRSGELRWVHERGGAVLSDTGEALFLEGYIEDIHAQAEVERRIRETEERFRLAAKATRDTIWDWDLISSSIEWDAAAGDALGYAHGELGSGVQWWLDRLHPEDVARVEASLARIIAGDEDRLTVEYRFRRANGEYAEILDRAFLIRDESGCPIRLVGAMHDQTERRMVASALAQRETRLQKIFEQAIVGIMEADPDGTVEMVNPRFCEILGRSAEELSSCTFLEYTHPDDLVWNIPLLNESLASGKPFQIEKRYIRPGGEIVWCNVSISFITSESGDVEKMIVVAEDITERKIDRAALSESEMLYRSVVQASVDCIKIVDLEGRIEFINEPGRCALQIDDLGSVIGRKWQDLWPECYSDAISAAVEAAAFGERIRFPGNCPTVKGEPRWWDVSVSPMITDDGKVDRILAISRDVTTSGAPRKNSDGRASTTR